MAEKKTIWLTGLVILITRIPFLFSGFGSEEDAWGLIHVAENISRTGIYEVSRMPGHPVQEYLLSQMWELPAWVLNFLTALVSSLGVVFFMFTLHKWKIPHHILAGIILGFTPVFFINSTNIMDYTWSLSLVMMAMYFLSQNKILLAGLILGIACGFRITAGAMVIPFAFYLLYHKNFMKQILVLGITTTAVALICFIPAFNIYGTDFITYYEYFPYPPLLKNLYKGTVAAWGVPGMIAVVSGVVLAVVRYGNISAEERKRMMPFVLMSISAILIYTYSFIRIPQKSAFVIPVIPFIILLFALLINNKQMVIITALMVASCFLFGINLDDKIRGSSSSVLALKTTIGNTPVAIDPLVGIVTADNLKRKQKIAYAKSVVGRLIKLKNKTVVIAGWWQNELNYFSARVEDSPVLYVYYIDETELIRYRDQGYDILYLPEQAYYNDLRFKGEFTEKYATAFE